MTSLLILNKSYVCFISYTGNRDHLKEGECRKRAGVGRKGEGEKGEGGERDPLYPPPYSPNDSFYTETVLQHIKYNENME